MIRFHAAIGLRVLTGMLLGSFAIGASHAQSKFPDRPIKILVGFSAGGGTDVAARVVGLKLGEALGQTFVIENRPGASGLIAAEQVAKSPADGYTIMVGSQTTLAVAPALYRSIQLDAAKAFTGIAMVGISPLVAVVPTSSPIKSMADLIAFAKSQPNGMNFASGGIGTTPHMSGELLALSAGIKMVHVAYKGEAPGVNDVLGGQIPFMFSNLSVVRAISRAASCGRSPSPPRSASRRCRTCRRSQKLSRASTPQPGSTWSPRPARRPTSWRRSTRR